MASLGNVGKTFNVPQSFRASTVFMLDKEPTSVDMTNTSTASSIPYSFAILTRNAIVTDRSRCDGSGIWHFYDMDDSGSQVYSISTYTQSGPTGEAWTATVVGATATVTQTFAAQRAVATAFT